MKAAPRLLAVSIAEIARCDLGIGVEVALEDMEAAADDHQQIVEVVRNAAGELAERIELLRLCELPLHGFELELRRCAAR